MNKVKYSVLVLAVLTQLSYGQKLVNGSLIVLQSKNGVNIAKFDNNVLIDPIESDNSNLIEIDKTCYVKQASVMNLTAKKNSVIYNREGIKIGTLLSDIKTEKPDTRNEFPGYKLLYIKGYCDAKNLKEITYSDLRASQKLLFEDSVQSRIIVYNENGGTYIKKTETSYSLEYSYVGDNPINYLTKKVKNTLLETNSEGDNSWITLTFYPNFSSNNSFTYTKKAHEFNVINNLLISKIYGCCSTPDLIELATFPENKTFLHANDSYHVISIPNSQMKIYFGVTYGEPDKTLTKICELQYSINGETTEKIVFKAKSKSENEKFMDSTPEVELISTSSKDRIVKNQDYTEMEAWSLNTLDNEAAVNGVGVKLTFEQETKKKSYAIFFKNGKIQAKEVIVDL